MHRNNQRQEAQMPGRVEVSNPSPSPGQLPVAICRAVNPLRVSDGYQ